MKIFGLKSALIATTYVFYVNSLAYAQEDIPDRSQKSSIKKFHKDNKRKAGLFFTDSGASYRWNEDRNEIRLGGFIQADSHTFFNDVSEPGNDSFTLRRIRPVFEIRFGKIYSFYVMPNLESSPGILDAFFESNYIKPFNLRVGKFKSPFGLERLQSATALALNERAFPTNLAPNREIGVQVFGNILWDTIEYQIGIFNGNVDNGSGIRDNVINSNNSGIDFVARLFSHPLKHAQTELLQGLGLGIAYSYGTQYGSTQSGHANLPTFISPGQQLIASYTQDAFASGSRERIGPQLYYHSGPFGIMAEYTISQQKIKIGTTSDKVANDAFQVQISWIIFNGDASFRRVQPHNPVTFENLNAIGAIQLVTRYSELNLDAKAFTHGLFNPDRSVSRAQDFGVGINWYLNHNIKLQLSYNQTHFTHGATGRFDRPTEKILFSRMQVAF
ncbi:phosphate-selective porin OprO and OprP [Nitrosomonas ureae]|uniref:Phosphate-selective porin OprO and OprP n=1 Tax=Nitrosomonas ureae TaxID=44577 RepID=A0A285C1F7_9PROT|nr:porin [Nitrosomonas ureae]SNX60863.1 phosphate-selective porin OprO and OprP [Nitrosomonas ureae]